MADSKINGFTVAWAAVGGLLMWSGGKGTNPAVTFRNLLNNKPVSSEPVAYPIEPGAVLSSDASSGLAGATGNAVADDALKYVGSPYKWGGAPGTTAGHDNGSDCSGFVNMVVGRDLGMAIPGYKAGQYTGATHGPTSQVWLLWGGAKGVPVAQAQAGDLACWITHMGIFTDNGQHIVSSLNTKSGVLVTTVAGAAPPGEPLHVRRLN